MALDFLALHPFVRDVAADKARGAVLGGALGDAVGLYTEFLPQKEARRWYTDGIELGVTAFRGDSHRDKFLPGAWTDDTDHALLLVLSFLHHYNTHQSAPSPTHLAQDFASRLTCWCEQGLLALAKPPLGLGRTIATAALHPNYLDDPHGLARRKWRAVKLGEKPASNGSLMRTHPIGVISVALELENAFELAAHVSTASHGDPRCTLACCAAVGVLRGLIRGKITEEASLDASLDAAKTWICSKPHLLNPNLPSPDELKSDPSLSADKPHPDVEHESSEVAQSSGADANDMQSTTTTAFLKLDEFDRYTRTQDLAPLELDDSQRMGYVYKCLGAGIVTLRQAIRSTTAATRTNAAGESAEKSGESKKEEAQKPAALSRSILFRQLMTELTLYGGDADTNGSVAGSLLGAWAGASQLPAAWLDELTDHAWLEDKNRRFVAAVGIRDAEGDAAWQMAPKDVDKDTDLHGGRQPLSKQERDEIEKSMVFAVVAKSKRRADEEQRMKAKPEGWRQWIPSMNGGLATK